MKPCYVSFHDGQWPYTQSEGLFCSGHPGSGIPDTAPSWEGPGRPACSRCIHLQGRLCRFHPEGVPDVLGPGGMCQGSVPHSGGAAALFR